MKTMTKVSIVVPIYKVEEYITKCVDSLLNQTYTNIEIILVDDGSPDACPLLCDKYAERDERIIVIHKQNGGLSSARNAGIEIASGEYIAFVDSDDFVRDDYIARLLDACLTNNCMMAACGYYEYYSADQSREICGAESSVVSSEEALLDIFTMKNEICVMAWNKLYHRSFFSEHGIRYPDGKIHEDVFTTYKCVALADKVAYVNEPLYYYVQRQSSIMGQAFSEKRLVLLEAVDSIADFIKERSPAFDRVYEYYVFLNQLTLLNAMADCRYNNKGLYKTLTKKIFATLPSLKKNEYFSKKNKLTCIFLRLGMRVFYVIRRLYKRV